MVLFRVRNQKMTIKNKVRAIGQMLVLNPVKQNILGFTYVLYIVFSVLRNCRNVALPQKGYNSILRQGKLNSVRNHLFNLGGSKIWETNQSMENGSNGKRATLLPSSGVSHFK